MTDARGRFNQGSAGQNEDTGPPVSLDLAPRGLLTRSKLVGEVHEDPPRT
jgi:hypothetical protein